MGRGDDAPQRVDEGVQDGIQKNQLLPKKNLEYGSGGVPGDLEQALHWYQKAAAQEHTRAMEAVARLS